ncbi:MAG: ATP-binding cassette domain-containing protein [Vicinamibacterales bacterium]
MSYSPAVIDFTNVSLARGGKPVLRNLTFSVARGETVVLVGRSGAGKSSILKLINRMLVPDAGSVAVNGVLTTNTDGVSLRRGAGYVIQEVALFPHMTITENVGVVPRLLRWETSRMAARVTELLALVGLPASEFGTRLPSEVSGGQRQRIGVARALAADPPILLMDEPFGALDPVTRTELHEEFKRIQQLVKKTVILVTHDMLEAFALGDRIGVLHDGEMAALDKPQAMARSTDPRVRSLLRPLAEMQASLPQL